MNDKLAQPRVVVLGGGFAGILAAQRIGRALGGAAVVTLINDRPHFVERVRLHQLATGQPLVKPAIENMLKPGTRTIVDRVTGIDLRARSVLLHTHEPCPYDYLVYALGSSVDTSSVDGVAENTHSLANEDAASKLLAQLSSLEKGKRVIVCGGGATGIELAAELAERFPLLSTTLVTRGQLGETLSLRGRDYLSQGLKRLRVDIRTNSTIRRVLADRVVLDSEELPFDTCVWAASFSAPSLGRAAGLAVSERSQAIGDRFLRSISHPEVFVAGDGACVEGAAVPIRMGCATAMPMAAQAADNLVALLQGKRLRPFRFAYAALFISLGRGDALAQWLHTNDRSRASILGGRLAAWLKDLTFRFNMWALRTGIYPWWLLPGSKEAK